MVQRARDGGKHCTIVQYYRTIAVYSNTPFPGPVGTRDVCRPTTGKQGYKNETRYPSKLRGVVKTQHGQRHDARDGGPIWGFVTRLSVSHSKELVGSSRRHNIVWHVARVTIPWRLHCLDYAPTAPRIHVPPTSQTKGTRGGSYDLF